jgi:hypothetical protein
MRCTRKTMLGVPIPEAPVARTCDAAASKYINDLEQVIRKIEEILYNPGATVKAVEPTVSINVDKRLSSIETQLQWLINTIAPEKNPCLDIPMPNRTNERLDQLRTQVSHLDGQMYRVREILAAMNYRVD